MNTKSHDLAISSLKISLEQTLQSCDRIHHGVAALHQAANFLLELVEEQGKAVKVTGETRTLKVKPPKKNSNAVQKKEKVIKLNKKIDDKPISPEDFSVRTYNVLYNDQGLRNISQIAEFTQEALMKLDRFGAGCLKEVKRVLEENGLNFSEK